MKKSILSLLLVACSFSLSFAQDGPEDDMHHKRPSFEEFVKMRIEFVVREMNLNSQDSVAFVSIYKQLQQEKLALLKKYGAVIHVPRSAYRNRNKGEAVSLSDTDYLNAVYAEANRDVEEANLDLAYLKKFEKVLSAKQLYDYKRAEEKLKREFMAPPKGSRPNNRNTPRGAR